MGPILDDEVLECEVGKVFTVDCEIFILNVLRVKLYFQATTKLLNALPVLCV